MARDRKQPGDSIVYPARDWNDLMGLLDSQRAQSMRLASPGRLVVIPEDGIEAGEAAICLVRYVHGSPTAGEPFAAFSSTSDKLLCLNPGRSKIDGDTVPATIGLALQIHGGYWVIASVFC